MKAILLLVSGLHLVWCCETDTHYLRDGQCCKMCGAGKRMMMNDNCEDPVCKDCKDGEYQSGYTSHTRCERQPSCDPNLNFLTEDNPSKTSLSKCRCRPGFFCQPGECNVCREHSVCRSGQRVLRRGTEVSDSVCQACGPGTFSDRDWSDSCRNWTRCPSGHTEQTEGSASSDRTCARTHTSPDARQHGPALITVGVVSLLICLAAAGFYFRRRRQQVKKAPPPGDPETALKLMAQQPQEDVDHSDLRSDPHSDLHSDPHSDLHTDPHTDLHSDLHSPVTDNGFPLQQEKGKASVLSCPESHAH